MAERTTIDVTVAPVRAGGAVVGAVIATLGHTTTLGFHPDMRRVMPTAEWSPDGLGGVVGRIRRKALLTVRPSVTGLHCSVEWVTRTPLGFARHFTEFPAATPEQAAARFREVLA